jgi:hypothetical protein
MTPAAFAVKNARKDIGHAPFLVGFKARAVLVEHFTCSLKNNFINKGWPHGLVDEVVSFWCW